MKTEIKDNNIVITIPLSANPPLSKSGKTRVVATTNGFLATTAIWNEKPIKLSLNAIIDR